MLLGQMVEVPELRRYRIQGEFSAIDALPTHPSVRFSSLETTTGGVMETVFEACLRHRVLT